MAENIADFYEKHFIQSQNKNSLFLSFEGIDGSGKSTQIQLTKSFLEANGYKVHILREPGGTVFGEKLREAILSSITPLTKISEAMLFASSRAQLLHEEIIPKLNEDKHAVILDRYIDSSIVYQGIAGELGVKTVLELHQYKPLNLIPNLTFLLDISVETALQRQKDRGGEKDYFESKAMEFFSSLRAGYLECLNLFPSRVKKIHAEDKVDLIQKEIQTYLKELL